MKCLKIKFYEFIMVSIILYTDNSSDYAICRQHFVKTASFNWPKLSTNLEDKRWIWEIINVTFSNFN